MRTEGPNSLRKRPRGRDFCQAFGHPLLPGPRGRPQDSRDTPGHSRDTPGTLPGHSRDIPGTLPGHSRDTPGTFPGHFRDTPRTCPPRFLEFRPQDACGGFSGLPRRLNGGLRDLQGSLGLLAGFSEPSRASWDTVPRLGAVLRIGGVSRKNWGVWIGLASGEP